MHLLSLPVLLLLLLLLLRFPTPTTSSALLRGTHTDTHNDSRPLPISPVDSISYTPPTKQYTHPHAPGADIDPPGIAIYNTLDDVPTTKFLSRARALEKCYAATPCWTSYVCGHRCEQVLMRVGSWCRDARAWARCHKARKFLRCFPRVCFRPSERRRGSVTGAPPASYEDRLSVAIVRYRRPLPTHEVLARSRRQSSTQSAIFK